MTIEIHGDEELIRDFTQAGLLAAYKAREAVEDAAHLVTERAIERVPKRRHQLAESIEWEMTGPLEAEVGPLNSRGGGYGHIVEKGLAGRPPQPFLGPALDDEARRIDDLFGDVIEDLL